MRIMAGSIMKENEFSPVGKAASLALVAFLLVAAAVNIARHEVPHPMAFVIVALGFVLFLAGKLSVVLRKKWVSFGTGLMSENMANLYRVGYWLMLVGVLATFT
jgi:uncharacterized protein YjeT (DUF2065 family)